MAWTSKRRTSRRVRSGTINPYRPASDKEIRHDTFVRKSSELSILPESPDQEQLLEIILRHDDRALKALHCMSNRALVQHRDRIVQRSEQAPKFSRIFDVVLLRPRLVVPRVRAAVFLPADHGSAPEKMSSRTFEFTSSFRLAVSSAIISSVVEFGPECLTTLSNWIGGRRSVYLRLLQHRPSRRRRPGRRPRCRGLPIDR